MRCCETPSFSQGTGPTLGRLLTRFWMARPVEPHLGPATPFGRWHDPRRSLIALWLSRNEALGVVRHFPVQNYVIASEIA